MKKRKNPLRTQRTSGLTCYGPVGANRSLFKRIEPRRMCHGPPAASSAPNKAARRVFQVPTGPRFRAAVSSNVCRYGSLPIFDSNDHLTFQHGTPEPWRLSPPVARTDPSRRSSPAGPSRASHYRGQRSASSPCSSDSTRFRATATDSDPPRLIV